MKISYQKDNLGGEYCNIECDAASSRHDVSVEKITDFEAFVASYMEEPFFMSATSDKRISNIPKETQWLGIKHNDNSYTLYYSLACDKFRTAFYGKEDCLNVVAVTGDEKVKDNEFKAFYRISGNDFYKLVKTAAESISKHYNTVMLRKQKQIPDFVKYFGWCTWDSFYDAVREEDIQAGLESFNKGGFVPRVVILDDGWQSVEEYNGRGEWKLTSFKPNKKFGYSLKNTINTAKKEYGVEKFFVWHAILGYWGGIDTFSDEMKKYSPTISKAYHTDEIKEVNPTRWNQEHFDFGMIDPAMAADFYEDYHTFLKNEGVDGVKIDVQGAIPGHSSGRGSRCALVKKLREGLEKSVCKNFNGELINCMSCNNDTIYHLMHTNVTRSSNDFFPKIVKSHSRHVYFNAVNSIWLGEFTVCDWDMFQTKHEYAQYHAASRAISGGPIYVSDRVDEHDFQLIKKLTSSDGKIFKPEGVAKLTVDSLFDNPLYTNQPFKIFNTNRYNGVVGAFSVDYDGEKSMQVYPKDIDGFSEGRYASFEFKSQKRAILDFNEFINIALKKSEFEIITFAEVVNGFAFIGLKEKFNSGGTFDNIKFTTDKISVDVKDAGTFLFYSEKRIYDVSSDKCLLEFLQNGCFVEVKTKESGKIIISF